MPNISVVFNTFHPCHIIFYSTPTPYFIPPSSYIPPFLLLPLSHRLPPKYLIHTSSYSLPNPSPLLHTHGMYKRPIGTREISAIISQKSTLVCETLLYMYGNNDWLFIL